MPYMLEQMISNRASLPQVAFLAAILSLVIFYLTKSSCSSQEWSEQNLGGPLTAQRGKSHVLVTGGAGFIGSHASLRLLQEGHAVTVLDNLSRGNIGAIRILKRSAKPSRFQFLEVDLGHSDLVLEVFRRTNIDLVIHFAALAYVGESVLDPVRYYRNITGATLNILEAMKETRVNKLVYSSTCATYGNPETLPVTELTPTDPINPYGRAKLYSERAIKDYAHANPELKVIIFRYFNVYGSDPNGELGEYPPPAVRQHGRISQACLDAAMGIIPELHIMGTTHPTPDGSCIRDYIHVTDLVEAHVLGMSHVANPPELYNVATGKGTSVKELVNACKAVTGREIKIVEQAEPRPGDYAEIYADPKKIMDKMGWKPKYTDVSEALGHAWAWRKAHPKGYSY